MKAITTALSTRINKAINNVTELGNMASLSKRERSALKIIYSHAGKRFVYETYSKTVPEMAYKYLAFVSKNPWEIYIKWDEKRKMFVA